jgi:hypothetical protein
MHLELQEIETLIAQKAYAQALPKLNKLLADHPTAHMAYKYRGICKYKLYNDMEGGGNDYECFIQNHPMLTDSTDYINDTFEMEDLLIYSDEGVHNYEHILRQLSKASNEEEYAFFNELCIPFKISHLKLQYNGTALVLDNENELDMIRPYLSPTFKKMLDNKLFVPSYRTDYYAAFPDVCYWTTYGGGKEIAQVYIADLMGQGLWDDITKDGFLKVKHFKELIKQYQLKASPLLECRNSVWND